jgi:hypothetical protein
MPIDSVPSDSAIHCLIRPARQFITADICMNLAVCLSDICNIVSILKFDLQLAHSNEFVGSRDETHRQAAFLSQSKSGISIIFMDIYKELSIENRSNETKCR